MPFKRNGRPPVIANETLERRTVLDWLGKAAVLAIGGTMLPACAEGGSSSTEPGNGVNDSGVVSNKCASDDFSFEPGDGLQAVYSGWGERTVDEQDLAQILANWTLTVNGLVESPVTLSFQNLLDLTRQNQVTDFHCVEGWSVYDVPWNGVHLSTIFDTVKPLPSAAYVNFISLGDIYLESLPLDVALERRSMLAYGVDCNTLPLAHGFPLRMVVPRKFGYKNPKYIYSIQLDSGPITGYWSQFGYPREGDVPEGRLRDGKY